MTKKDYIKFAEMIARRTSQYISKSKHVTEKDFTFMGIDIIQSDLIDILKADNSAFNVEKFNAYIKKRVKELSR